MNRNLFIISYSFSVLLICLFFGCRDTKINPYETDTGIYSIYGALNIDESRHVIRVRDLNQFHNDSSSINLDATVTFHDLENGTSQVLRDSIVQFPANFTHNFILEKELQPRTTYRISVERSDGESVSTTFTTPSVTNLQILPIGADVNCSGQVRFAFQNVLPSEIIRWDIGFEYNESIYWLEFSRFCGQKYEESLQRLLVTTRPIILLNEIFPSSSDSFNACQPPWTPTVRCKNLDTETAHLRYLHLGPEWQKVFPIYANDPLDIDAVANGLGFLGAYHQGSATFQVTPD